MSYCRFHNTELDMKDCIEAIQERKSMSDDEIIKGKRMFKDIIEMLIDEDIICLDEEYDDYETRLDEMFDEMKGK